MENTFPELETERFVLCKITPDDAAALFEYWGKEEVFRYIPRPAVQTISEALDLVNQWDAKFQNHEVIRWGIKTKNDNQLVGDCGFHNWMKSHRRAEVGYLIAPPFWGRGIVTEVLPEMIRYGFTNMNLHRIEALYALENTASKKALDRVGFRTEGVLRESYVINDQFFSPAICSLLEQQYREQQ